MCFHFRRGEGEGAEGGQVPQTTQASGQRVRALYDIPYMFEAREFLRKKLIGKKVLVTLLWLCGCPFCCCV